MFLSIFLGRPEKTSGGEQFNYIKNTGGTKKMRTIGDKWATFQTLNSRNNSRPYYVLMDFEMNLLNQSTGYTPDSEEYLEWLLKGLVEYRK